MNCKHQQIETRQISQLGGPPEIEYLAHCSPLSNKNSMVYSVLNEMGEIGSIDTDHCPFYCHEQHCPFSDGKTYNVEVFVGKVRHGGNNAKLDAVTGFSIEDGCPGVSMSEIPNLENIVIQRIVDRNMSAQPVGNNVFLQVIPKP